MPIVPRYVTALALFLSAAYTVYTLNLLSSSSCPPSPPQLPVRLHLSPPPSDTTDSYNKTTPTQEEPTSLRHIFFGIAASARLWNRRKEYVKLWWRSDQMHGALWLDKPVKAHKSERRSLPPIVVSGDTSSFPYTHKLGHRAAIRISRIVQESLRLGLPDGVRWLVMGDDDTVFIPENLARALSRFDHRQFYYIGGNSESHLQNIFISYGMAFGGGGFAISYPLAVALAGMQDRCIRRYPELYGGDDRVQACMAELGVPLTRHGGFHQYDVRGDLFGLLAAHPVAPLLSLHHLEMVEPIFPNETRVGALSRLFEGPVRLDSDGVAQQSICYDGGRRWTVSVSWGFAVQVVRGVVSAREMETPVRTFVSWQKKAEYTMYAFNTRPVARTACRRPFVFYLESARPAGESGFTVTAYGPRRVLEGGGKTGDCRWDGADPTSIDRVLVHRRKDPSLWERAPRRECCRVMKDPKFAGEDRRSTMLVQVGACRDGETIEL